MTQPINKTADATGAANSMPTNQGFEPEGFSGFGSSDFATESDSGNGDSDQNDGLNAYRFAGAPNSSPQSLKSENDLPTNSEKSVESFGFPSVFLDFDAPDSPSIKGGANESPYIGKGPPPMETKGNETAVTKSTEGKATGEPSLEGMAKWFEDNFDTLDKDKDGSISKSEMDKALLDPKVATGDGAVYLSTMNGKVPSWTSNFGLNPDGENPPTSGISRESLTKMRDVAKKQESKESQDKLGISGIERDMHRIDQNDDQCITKQELDDALKKDDWSPKQRENLENLKKQFSEVAKTSNDTSDPVFTADAAYPGSNFGMDLKEEFVSPVDLQRFTSDENKFAQTLKNSIKETSEEKTSSHAINQKGTDSCFLLAPLEALQRKDPEAIDKMMKDNGDGTVTVTFPGDPKRPVTIAKPTEGEQTEFTGGKAGIIEKAFAEYVSELPEDEQHKFLVLSGKERPDLIQDNLSGGGLCDSAMGLLTGLEAAGQPVSLMSEKQIIDTLTAATQSDQLIAIGTKPRTGKDSGIFPSHGYSLSFDQKTNTITLTNPVKPSSNNPAEPTKPDGSPLDGKSDGSFTLTMEQFKKYADHLYIGRSKP